MRRPVTLSFQKAFFGMRRESTTRATPGERAAITRLVRVKRWHVPVFADGVHILEPANCRIAINFGKKSVFSANEAGITRSVDFLKNGLIFLPPGRTPVLTVPDNRRELRSKGGRVRSFVNILALLFDVTLFEEAASLVGQSLSLARNLPHLSLALDPVGCALAKSLAVALDNRLNCSVAQLEPIALALAVWIVEHRGDDSHVHLKFPPVQCAIARALQRIQTDFDQNLSLQVLADEASMSRFHFARCFKQITGLSAHQYLIRTRIDNAKRLLTECVETGRTTAMQDIAFDTGFSSPSQFSAAFARSTGISPSAWLRALTRSCHGKD